MGDDAFGADSVDQEEATPEILQNGELLLTRRSIGDDRGVG